MEDPATKIKQLSESLQAQQAKTTKKKEEIETLTKTCATLDKELYELRLQAAELEGATEFRKSAVVQDKENLKKQIEYAKKVIGADKTALEAEKAQLLTALEEAQAKAKTIQNQKNDLLRDKKGTLSLTEKTNAVEEGKRDEDDEAPLETLIKRIEVKKEQTGFLTVDTVTKIVDVCIILAGRKFRETVRENRKKLRNNKNMDLKAYLDQSGKEMSQHTEVYQDIETQVLKALGVEKTVLDKSIEYYMSIRNLDVMALMNLLGEKLRSYLRSTTVIDVEKFKEIMKFKINFIEKEAPIMFGEDHKRKVVQSQLASVSGNYAQKEAMSIDMIRNFFEFKLGSAIYEKFLVEDEDIREASSQPDIQFNLDVAELMIKNEEAMVKYMPQPAMPGEQGQLRHP